MQTLGFRVPYQNKFQKRNIPVMPSLVLHAQKEETRGPHISIVGERAVSWEREGASGKNAVKLLPAFIRFCSKCHHLLVP